MKARVLIAGGLTMFALAAPGFAQSMFQPDPPNVGIDQKLGAMVPLDLTFRDESGADITLAELVTDKPIVLSLVYYECPMLCNEIMKGMLDCFNDLKFTLGDEFTAISVSIDHDETSFIAGKKKETYSTAYKTPEALVNWRFLTGDEANIRKLAETVGYRYAFLPSTGEFAHGSGIMVLTPKGKVARYFYGIDYPVRDVQFGLMEAAEERIGSLADVLLLMCYHYNPATGTYGNIVFGSLRIAAAATVVGLIALVGLLVRADRKRQRIRANSLTGVPVDIVSSGRANPTT